MLRNDDLDRDRARPEFVEAMIEDLHWLGIEWDEGPDVGGLFGSYSQSERIHLYQAAFQKLRPHIYPCTCSRQEVLRSLQAPHQGEEEPLYPGTCRHRKLESIPATAKINWRFRVPENIAVEFHDGYSGPQKFVGGIDFGDFVVWRADQLPSYQLACVVDDAGMRISEVVRGADLLLSTARQLLLYRALNLAAPAFYHCPLMLDAKGARLAKRHDALSLRAMRRAGRKPEEIVAGWKVDPD